ncbi:MAG: LLM class flavin-dependent oxidoreductase [archaeon]
MKFGLATDCSRRIQRTVELAKEAEDLGYDCLWIADQNLYRDVHVTTALCALETTRIRLGIGVTNPLTRHPAIMTAALATSDELSGSRMIMGLGIGSSLNLLHPLGIKRQRTGPCLRESFQVMKMFLSGDPVHFKGEFFDINHKGLGFPTRDIPILIASRSPRTLALAGEIADGVIVSSFASPKAMEYAMSEVKRGFRKRKEKTEFQIVLWTRLSMNDDQKSAIEALRPHLPYRIWDDNPTTLEGLGYDPRVTQQIKDLYSKGETRLAEKLVTKEMLDDFGIAGPLKVCRDKIKSLRSMGVTHIAVSPVGKSEKDRARLRREFAAHIAPDFQHQRATS